MRLLSWNVNGLRSVLDKELFAVFVEKYQPDVLCLQETKTRDKVDVRIPGYEEFWNHARKAGYAGTAVFTRIKPLNHAYGIGIPRHDEEGRVITLEFNNFFLVNVYVPNAKRDLSRLSYRTKEWDVDFLKYLRTLEKKKAVVFCGDLNVAHQEIDLSNPKANVKNHGFTPQERAGFDKIIEAGFIDTFREFEKAGGQYTWWSRFNNCRQRNIGWRIDYFCISSSLRRKLNKAFILDAVMGSDHCPVGIELNTH
ncbi:MAG: exodeoxyribonuclease III [Candidatus Omnitrophica bacterium]|nr:exodeoxyribonuclease III [Candidatus Omnitrophota bacterium]MDE2222238.1 exodeoxyribonuclease III [Candidatus Omnitrophota bacterium]